jgi:hypothetical protein
MNNDFERLFPYQFETVDASINEYLQSEDYLRYQRSLVTTGSVYYKLIFWTPKLVGKKGELQIGTLLSWEWGELHVVKINSGNTRVFLKPNDNPDFNPSPNETSARQKYLSGVVEGLWEWLETRQYEEEKIDESVSQKKIDEVTKPWMQIPDKEWDRVALKMWWNYYTCKEISQLVHVTPERVTNRISELRQIHGQGIVPLDKQRRKMRLMSS